MSNRLFPHRLFGNYIIEIAKLFQLNFRDFQATPSAPITPLQIRYGTPRAAFRYWYKRFNGQMILPSMNFFGIDSRRRYDRECPNPRLFTSDKRSYNTANKTVVVNRPPMHFEITYQFSLYNNNGRERDAMIHKIMQWFYRGQCSLRWYPDKTNYPDVFLFMPLSLEETVSDETDMEGLDEKETRDIIKTNFNIISQAVVPFDYLEIPAVSRILVDEEISDNGIIEINTVIDGSIFDLLVYSRHTLNFSGTADCAINDKWYYNFNSYGKTIISGTAIIS